MLSDPAVPRVEIPDDPDIWSDDALALGIDVHGWAVFVLTASAWRSETPVCVEVHDDAPAVDASWPRVAEASVRVRGDRLLLDPLYGDGSDGVEVPLGAAGDYRLRVHARGEPAGEATDDAYLLQIWPAPPAPARRLRPSGRAP